MDPEKLYSDVEEFTAAMGIRGRGNSTWGMPKFTEEEIRLCFPKLKAIFYAAGTVQAFVPLDMLDSFKASIEAVLGENSCHVLNIRQEGGIRVN